MPICTSDASWVNKPLALVFVDLILVRVTGDQNIHIHLSLNHRETVCITPRDDLVSVNKTYFKLTNLDNF